MKSVWRLFLDQNLRYEVNEMLREFGVDALHASDAGLRRASDPEILQFALDQNRTFVTHDSEFGDLNIFPLPAHHTGVIRLKVHPPIPQTVADILIPFLDTHTPENVYDSLVVITARKIRFRKT
ncbi:MAG: DUF5615 family PIN-like protein [Ignavibacteriae bacterium]|nr:DUF5615 family PIN-like protein [Ignavibacteriota bacterium]